AVLPGCSTRKFHSSKRNAFQGINTQPIGTISVGRGGECEIQAVAKAPTREIATEPIAFDGNKRIL
ncbi:MAG: hypothetical protein NZ802_05340, partial [Candidatus Poseidoniales archaeon]|nr:hypothetical protein [Candidatus Poseidoniales archaeon]